MDGLFGGVRDVLRHLPRLQPLDPGELGGRVVDDPLADDVPVADHLDGVAGRELSLDCSYAHRQEAGTALPKGARGTPVHHHPALAWLGITQPELEARG